jgi:translation initiation factor eIF-2B subunit gamma
MEFHAFILCGPGKILSPFSSVRASGKAKALLPVANTPMIDKVLDWCELAFFPKVTFVVNEESHDDIAIALDNYNQNLKDQLKKESQEESPYKTQIDILKIDCEFSGAVFNYLHKNAIKPFENFVLLPCDFVTNLPPQVLIEAYRNKNDGDVGLLVNYRNKFDIEDKKHKIFPINYTIYAESTDDQAKFLDMYSADDIEFHKALKIRTQMSWRYPNSIISKKLLNSGIFFGSADIFDIFDSNPDKFNESYFNCRSVTKVIRDIARRSWRHSQVHETISFLVVPEIATFFRINNIPVLMEANRYIMQQQAVQKAKQQQQQTPAPRDKLAANVGIDSLVGADTVLGERTNVKKTVIGKNCVIGKRVKLTGTLILDNVVIEDDVQLENCIVGSNVIIHTKAKLTNCNVEATHEIQGGSHFKGETLLSLSLEGIIEEMTDSSDDSGSESDSESDFSEEYDDNSDGLFDY